MNALSPSRRGLLLASLAIVILGFIVFGQVLRFTFVTSDDTELILHNPHVLGWWATPLRDRLLTIEFHYAMPVTLASFALDMWTWSGRAVGFHLTNLALHIVCALLVLRILSREVRLGAAIVGAIFFLLHPVQAEVVSFVTQRKDALAALFSLLSLAVLQARWAALRWRDVAAILSLAALAALSKPTGALIGAALAGAFLVARGVQLLRRQEWILIAGLMGVSGVVVVLDAAIGRAIGMVIDTTPKSPTERLSLLSDTLVHYANILVFPVDLAPRVVAPTHLSTPLLLGATLLACAFVAVAAHVVAKRRPRASLVCFWLGVSYVPISNVVPISRYVADGYLYVAMVAVAFAFAAAFDAVLERSTRQLHAVLVYAVAAIVGGVFAVLSNVQASVWHDDVRLAGYVYRLLPLSSEAFVAYSEALDHAGKHGEAVDLAVDHFSRAVAAWPASIGARQQLAHTLLARGDVDGAERVVEETPQPLRSGTGYWEMAFDVAKTAHRWTDALAAARAVAAIDPRHPLASQVSALEALVAQLPKKRP